MPATPGIFALKDCTLIAIATGRKARTLNEFIDELWTINADSIYYHFWGGLLQARFEEREYNNDFAGWSRHGLHDTVLAERLAMVDPTQYPDSEALRQATGTLVEQRAAENEPLLMRPATMQFEFIRSQIVVFDTNLRVERPEEMAGLLPHLSTGGIFYHFIDARRRQPSGEDDFRVWLNSFDGIYSALSEQIADLDPYFSNLVQLREQLTTIFHSHLRSEL